MTITMGQLVNDVFEAYERRYGDTELAAVATEVTVGDILRTSRKRVTRVRKAT
jgi:RNase P/RNase MRP subunit POP5